MPSENSEIDENELEKIKLELYGLPFYDSLAVFIIDPKKTDQYIPMRLTVKLVEKHEKTSEVDITRSLLDTRVTSLGRGIYAKITYRPLHESPANDCDENKRAVFGVAEYVGNKKLTIEEVAELVASRYYKLKRAYSN